ncbi:hypothetical protein Tco_0582788 [Tanacetum coccineum]
MFLYVDQLEKQLDQRRNFKEIGTNGFFKSTRDTVSDVRQVTDGKVDTGKAVDASLVNTESIGIESKEQDTSSRSGSDAHADDADIRPIYDEDPMAEVQTTVEINVFATRQQHTEQPEFNNEGEVDQNVEQCHDTCPLPATLTDNQTTELSDQSLEFELFRSQKDKASWLIFESTSHEAKVKHDIDVIETINIKLEHKVAKLLKENETLKRHYKEMFDSIKTTKAKNIEHTTYLIANNAKFKAQLQEKGFAIAALKNELRTLTGNSERESAVAKPHHMIAPGSSRSYALSWKPCQGDSLNLPDHRIHKHGDGDALFQLKSDSLPHAHAQTTKTYYTHRDSRLMKAQELKTKTFVQTMIYKIFLQRYQVYQGRLLASF